MLVVDLDAHQGDGTASVFGGCPWASIYNLYEGDIFLAASNPRTSRWRSDPEKREWR